MNKRKGLIKVAMIGCGNVAHYSHAPEIMKNPALQCVAFADIDRKRAEFFSREFGGGDAYADYRKVLDRKDVDAVAVLTMPRDHAQIAIAALQAGKHVFVEKPISHDIDTAEQMVETAKSTGRKLFVGFILRYNPVFRTMAEAIHSGMIGKPKLYRMIGFERYKSTWKCHGADKRTAWERALNFIKHTSPAIDCGSHYVDLMRWFSGAEARRVQAIGSRINPDVPDGMFDWEQLQIEFDDGSRGSYEVGWGFSFPDRRYSKEAIGPKGYIGVYLAETREGHESGYRVVFCPNDGVEKEIPLLKPVDFNNEWEYFARMLADDIDPMPVLNDALASLRIVTAAHKSALEGSVVNL